MQGWQRESIGIGPQVVTMYISKGAARACPHNCTDGGSDRRGLG